MLAEGELTVAYALLRKPLKDNLFYLEWMLADLPDFLGVFRSDGPDGLERTLKDRSTCHHQDGCAEGRTRTIVRRRIHRKTPVRQVRVLWLRQPVGPSQSPDHDTSAP